MRRLHFIARLVALSTLFLASSSSGVANANGRFPEANQMAFSASDPALVLLRVTFGLLISHDRGKSFGWVCEQAIGYSGEEDPMYAATPNAILGTTFQGVTVSRTTAGCDWSLAGGDLAQRVFVDLASTTKSVVAFSSVFDQRPADGGSALFASKIWETADEGKTWSLLGGGGAGAALLDPTFLGSTIDLAASDAQRIYLSVVRNPGVVPGRAFLLVSKDHGQTWSEEPIALEGTEHSAFIAGVDPNDAERVYIRTANRAAKPTRLLVRDNAQGPQRVVFTSQGPLLGFALSKDGSKIWIGGPKDGLNVARSTDLTFTRVSNLDVRCLAHNDDGLWACSTESGTVEGGVGGGGFVAGISRDDGVSFEPRLHFCEIQGPLACSSPSPCAALWPQQRAALGCDAASSDAGGALVDAAGGDVAKPIALTSRGSGCSTGFTFGVASSGAFVAMAATGIALLRRRRR